VFAPAKNLARGLVWFLNKANLKYETAFWSLIFLSSIGIRASFKLLHKRQMFGAVPPG
jgi:hypothetical protein